MHFNMAGHHSIVKIERHVFVTLVGNVLNEPFSCYF